MSEPERNVVRWGKAHPRVQKVAMEILNIHLTELLIITGIALVVFGPERLPEIGRFAGKQVARFLAWQQQSPELKLINDVRAEFEQEIASLRDDLVRTRRQLDLSPGLDLNSIRDELRPMLNLRDAVKPTGISGSATLAGATAVPAQTLEATSAPPSAESSLKLADPPTATALAPSAASAVPEATPAPASAELAVRPPPSGTVQAVARPNLVTTTAPTNVIDQPARLVDNGHSPVPRGEPTAASEESQLLRQQIERLSADLHTLVSALHARGVLGDDWPPAGVTNEQETLSR